MAEIKDYIYGSSVNGSNHHKLLGMFNIREIQGLCSIRRDVVL